MNIFLWLHVKEFFWCMHPGTFSKIKTFPQCTPYCIYVYTDIYQGLKIFANSCIQYSWRLILVIFGQIWKKHNITKKANKLAAAIFHKILLEKCDNKKVKSINERWNQLILIWFICLFVFLEDYWFSSFWSAVVFIQAWRLEILKIKRFFFFLWQI